MKLPVLSYFGILCCAPLWAGIPNAPCNEPFVFRDAQVNVVVLPYSNPEFISPELERAGSELTLLLQEKILYSALKYPNIGTVRMVPLDRSRSNDCQASIVARKILGVSPGAHQQLGPDGGAILLWGQIYKEGDQIYLCSYATFVTRSSDDAIESTGQGHGVFVAKLPSNVVTFPVRVISTGMLRDIAAAFALSGVLHKDRDVSSPATFMPLNATDGSLPYQVLEATPDGWMRIRAMDGFASGWIYANPALKSDLLAKQLPELNFIDGAIGYLEFRKGNHPAAIRARAQPSLMSFVELGSSADTALATATAEAMVAVMDERDPEFRQRGYELARDAVARIPYNADARNLELVYRLDIRGGELLRPNTWEPFADAFAQAAALGPGKKYILDNLDSFYKAVMAEPGFAGTSVTEEVRKRREELTRVRTAAMPINQ